MIRCIIIDDEQTHLNYFKEMIQNNFSDVELIGEADNVLEGIQLVNNSSFDILILDVRMPPYTGFDVLKSVEKRDFQVVFTTSYGEYAIEAIRFSALDYLLKPYSAEDLKAAYERFKGLAAKTSIPQKIENLLHNINPANSKKRIGLSDKNGIDFFDIDDIVYCKSENVYTTVFFENKKEVVTSKPIKDYEKELSNFSFYRIHNSYLVNLNKVQKYIKGIQGQVKMTTGITLEVARHRKDGFLQNLNAV